MRVLVVDDSAFMRRAMQQMLASDPAIEIVGVAKNGKQGLELARELRPDVITLDIEMPEMDGLTALRRIMRECPTRVIMVSSLTTEGSVAALQALRMGAADFIAKQHSTVDFKIGEIQSELLHKVKALAKRNEPATAAETLPPQEIPDLSLHRLDAVCIGSSTGGPPVLETLLAGLPATFGPAVLIAQHMPPLFTKSMADRFDQICPLPVVHAEDGMLLQRRTVYVAPGGKHLHIDKAGLGRQRLRVSDEPTTAHYRPSVDVLLSTAASAFGKRCLGIVLTGIGEDGLRGARDLHAAGGPILAQSRTSCVVYGMPRAVAEAGVATAALSPAEMVKALAGASTAAAA